MQRYQGSRSTIFKARSTNCILKRLVQERSCAPAAGSLKMEESMANSWLQDSRGLVTTKIGEVYNSGGQESESSLSLQLSHNIDEFTPSSSSTFSSETAEHYSYFDPYMRSDAVACEGVTTSSDPTSVTSDCRSEGGSDMSQVLEQLLAYNDTATWGIHQPGESSLALKSTIGEPLHQLPGWTQHDYMMEEWQQNSSCTSLKPVVPTEMELTDPLHHGPWMMEMPEGLAYNSLTPLDQIHAPFQNHSFHSAGPVHSFEERQRQLRSSPFHVGTSNSTEVNRKAAARKNRILLRQKSAPHPRGSIDSLGSPRALKKMHSTKISREFLICNYVRSRDMDPLRFLLHKVLQRSDVSNLGRIVISKKEAETHLPYLAMKEGIFITMEDFDTAEQWTFRYRFWPNSRSRMYLLESTGDFVKTHHLKKGDILVIWRNSSRGTFVIRGLVAQPCWRASNISADEGSDVKDHAREDDSKGKTKASG